MSENSMHVRTNEVSEDFIGERRLWTAVLVQAVEDWRNGTLRARREAQEFLFEGGADFERVCAGAGIDPASLSARLLKIGMKISTQGPLPRALAA